MLISETFTKVYCATCRREVKSPEEFREHARTHHLEFWWRENPRMMQMLQTMMEDRKRSR